MNIIRSEFLKSRGLLFNKAVLIIPIINVLLTFIFSLISGPVGINLLRETIVNQWGILWNSVMIVIIVSTQEKMEVNNNMYYKNFLVVNIDLKKIQISRIFISICYYAISNLMLLILIVPLNVLFIHRSSVQFWNIAISIVIIFVVSMWEIPFYSLIVQKLNIHVAYLLLIPIKVMGMYFSISRWNKYVPLDWPTISVTKIINLSPNGTLDINDLLLGVNTYFVIGLSIACLFILLFLNLYYFDKKYSNM